jgi:hypothetical protein
LNRSSEGPENFFIVRIPELAMVKEGYRFGANGDYVAATFRKNTSSANVWV